MKKKAFFYCVFIKKNYIYIYVIERGTQTDSVTPPQTNKQTNN